MGYRSRLRLFVADALAVGVQLVLARESSHYLATVMRRSVGNRIAFFNGRDGEWWGEITRADKKQVLATITTQLGPQTPEPDIWLAFAPLKSARTDMIVEKATELGVSRVIPIRTERTRARRVNSERLAATVREAAEQCERLTLAQVAPYRKLSDVLKEWPLDRPLLFADEQLDAPAMAAVCAALAPTTPCGVLVGPEGGFSAGERAYIRTHPAVRPGHLGPRILRADTASIATLALVQSHLGDWQQEKLSRSWWKYYPLSSGFGLHPDRLDPKV